MSVKHAILALVYHTSRHGYDIKTSFEKMVHQQWRLNAGQIYTTLDRLVRDGLVEPLNEESKERKEYKITNKGKDELHQWLLQPVERSLMKDAFYFKLLCAKEIDFNNQRDMLKQQQSAIVRNMMQLRQLRNQLDEFRHRYMVYLIEGGILHLEADMKWLEMILDEENMD